MDKVKYLYKCKICGSKELTDVIKIEPQHLSATFVKTNVGLDISNIKVPMTLTLCDQNLNPAGCGLLQLREEVHADLLYRQYFYRSATSGTMVADLREVIEDIHKHVTLAEEDIVVDIGGNDGTTISFYSNDLRRVVFEPAKNINWDHLDKSITILNDYFNASLFLKLFPGKKAKVLGCNAMFYDLSDPNSFVHDIGQLLDPKGVWCIQLSYLPLMIENMNFYDICHEHLSYYSLNALINLVDRHDMMIVDASTNPVNGGSIRVFVVHKTNTVSCTSAGTANVLDLLRREKEMKLTDPKIYKDFFQKMTDLAKSVNSFIDNEIKLGGKVYGLGASTKGNVLLQFFGIGKDKLPFISERNPEKVGLKTLGTDIELISEEQARGMEPSSMLVLPWYFKDEIVKRESEYLAKGGKLIVPMPYAHVVTESGEINI